MNELFGIVEQVNQSPAGGDTFILGQWLSLNSKSLTPPFDESIIQYRDSSIIGEWKLKSVSTIAGNTINSKQVLTLSPLNNGQSLVPGDLLITENLYMDVKISTTNKDLVNTCIGITKENDIKFGTIFIKDDNNYKLHLISDSPSFFDSFSLERDYEIKLVNFNSLVSECISFRIFSDLLEISEEKPLEINFEYENRLFLNDFINTMQPIRNFILNSSQERFYSHVSRSKNERHPFEPAFSAQAGSVKAFLHPHIEVDSQLDAFVLDELFFGYKLLYTSLEYAEKRNDSSLINLLNANNLSNLNNYLVNLKKISQASQKTSGFSIRHSNFQSLSITNKAINTITSALSKIESNEITITGQFYAIDTRRRWFKIQFEDFDWTFRYSEDQLEIENIGLYKNLKVTGITEIPIDSKRGTASLSTFQYMGD